MEVLLDWIEGAEGALSAHHGVYSPGGCYDFRRPNDALWLTGRYLQWSEGNRFFTAPLVRPEAVNRYDIGSSQTVTLTAGTTFTAYRMTSLTSAPSEVIGFSPTTMWYSKGGKQYASYEKCGTVKRERERIFLHWIRRVEHFRDDQQ